MTRSHGTPTFPYTNGQLVTVGARILAALPKGLSGVDSKLALKYSEQGERLEAAIGAMFDALHNGHVATFPTRSLVLDEVDYKKLAQFITPEGKVTLENFRKCLTPKWREEDGVIYFSVISDGTTGEDWITRLESKGFRVGDYAKQVLRTPSFKPTNGLLTEVAVLKGMLFEDNDRITEKIRAEADKRKLSKPNAELACLIREKFTDKEIEAMGLWYIVAMHEPVNDSDGDPSLLSADRDDDGRWLHAYCVRPGSRWDRASGFAFAVSPPE